MRTPSVLTGPLCGELAWKVVRWGRSWAGAEGPGGQAEGVAFRFFSVGSGETWKALHGAWCEQPQARGEEPVGV